MKHFTLSLMVAAFAAIASASPVPARDIVRRGEPIEDIIVRVIAGKVKENATNAYQDEIDAASEDPAAVLGKRFSIPASSKRESEALAEDSIIILRAGSAGTAYDEDIEAADPVEVLGKPL